MFMMSGNWHAAVPVRITDRFCKYDAYKEAGDGYPPLLILHGTTPVAYSADL